MSNPKLLPRSGTSRSMVSFNNSEIESNIDGTTKTRLSRIGSITSISLQSKPALSKTEEELSKHGSFEINRKSTPLRSRRIVSIDPNLNLADVNFAASAKKALGLNSNSNKGLPKPNKSYRFRCESILDGTETHPPQKVEWNATFERSIEQLIYPSLQKFDNEAYEKKKALHYQLHGYHAPRSKVDIDSSTALDSSNFFNLEQLQDAEAMPSILPDWTVVVKDLHTKKNNVQNTLVDDLEIEGEAFLREKLKSTYASRLAIEEEESKSPTNTTNDKMLLRILSLDPKNRRKHEPLKDLDPDSADYLYSVLEKNRKLAADGVAVKPVKLNKLSSEGRYYNIIRIYFTLNSFFLSIFVRSYFMQRGNAATTQ